MAWTILDKSFVAWRTLSLLLMYHVICSYSVESGVTPKPASQANPTLCQEGCECPEAGKLVCKAGFSDLAKITNRSAIHSLTINSHNITALNPGDFANFTHLEQLDLSDGYIEKIAPGTFDDIKDTIKLIKLSNNRLGELDVGVFNGLNYIDEISLDINHLNKLKEESFVNLPLLKTLLIEGNHIETIEKGAFKSLPAIEHINLHNNYLLEIPADALDNLPSLKELTLSFNQIAAIADTMNLLLPNLEVINLNSNPLSKLTSFPRISEKLKILNLQFTHLPNVGKQTWKNVLSVEQLHLSGTKLQSIHEGMFDGLVNLKWIAVGNMLDMTSIGPNSFKGLNKLDTVDVAGSHLLSHIDENAFRFANISSFFAYDCGLQNIPEKLLPWSEMKAVLIHKNPIKCDCNVKWMQNNAIFGNNSDVKSSFDELECKTPHSLLNYKVTKVTPDLLICHHDDHVKRVTTGVIVVIIVAVFFTIIALLVKCRKRIMISCRKYYQYRRYKNDLVFTVEHDTSVAELEDTEHYDDRPLKDMRLETRPLDI